MTSNWKRPGKYPYGCRSVFISVILLLAVGYGVYAVESKDPNCIYNCPRVKIRNVDERNQKEIEVTRPILLTPEMILGVAPGLRIFFTNGDEYYVIGVDVYKDYRENGLSFPMGTFEKQSGEYSYKRVSGDQDDEGSGVEFDLMEVKELHLVGRSGFDGLSGTDAHSFLECLVGGDIEGRKFWLRSMSGDFNARLSGSLYVGSRKKATLRYPSSEGRDSPWSFKELISGDLAPTYREFRVDGDERNYLRREDQWILHGDDWVRMQDVIDQETGHSIHTRRVNVLLITDDFRSGESASSRIKDEVEYDKRHFDSKENDIGIRERVLRWMMGNADEENVSKQRKSAYIASYYKEFIGRWITGGENIREALIDRGIDSVGFYGRSKLDSRFILLAEVNELRNDWNLNNFLDAFGNLNEHEISHMFAGGLRSVNAKETAYSYITARSTNADPRASVVVLDNPVGAPCASPPEATLQGTGRRRVRVQVGVMQGFLVVNQHEFEQLFSSAVGVVGEGVRECE